MKLGTQLVPPPENDTDVSNKRYVDQIGGRGNADFILLRLSSNQNFSGGGTKVQFDQIVNSRELTNSTGTISGLKAGRTYLCQFGGRILDVGGGSVEFTFYDATGDTVIGVGAIMKTMGSADDETSAPIATAIFTPSQDSDLELRTIAASDTGQIIIGGAADYTWMMVVEIFGSPLHGGLEHLETIEVTGSAAQSITFSNLDGDSDEMYVLKGTILKGDGASDIVYGVRPNGSSTGAEGNYVKYRDATGPSAVNVTDALPIGQLTTLDSADSTMFFTFEMRTPIGWNRSYHAVWGAQEDSGTVSTNGIAGGGWQEKVTNITSLEVRGSVASALGVGTKVSLFRLRAQNGVLPTLDKANVYTAAQTVTKYDLGTASGTVNIDASLSNTFDLIVNGATTIAAPTNLEDGQSIVLRIRQDGTGSRAVTFDSVWDFGGDGDPDTSADAADSMIIVSGTSDGTNVFASAKSGFTNT